MNRVLLLLPFVAAVFVGGVALFAYQHGALFPILDPSGPIAAQERWVIIATVVLCAIIVIPLFILLFYVAWKYRADSPRSTVHHKPNWDHDNKLVEFSWWLVPTVIVVLLGVIMWRSAHQLDPYRPLLSTNTPLTVDVVALDWKWLFIYPAQGIATVNFLEIPQGVPVHFELTADAPMNSFWIPSLGGQIMVMPGMQTQLNLLASKTGTYNGFSANISGEGFSGMAFLVKSVNTNEFATWVAATSASSTPLTPTAYSALEQPSEYNPISSYAPVLLGLYPSIIMKYMSPTPVATSSSAMSTGAATTSSAMPGMIMQ